VHGQPGRGQLQQRAAPVRRVRHPDQLAALLAAGEDAGQRGRREAGGAGQVGGGDRVEVDDQPVQGELLDRQRRAGQGLGDQPGGQDGDQPEVDQDVLGL
jgi:hypothetical protein